MAATEPLFSSAPPVIQALITSSFAGGSLSCMGGIFGSSACDASDHRREASGSPAAITAPVDPPCINPANVASDKSLFFVSWLWQLKQCSRKIGFTCSSYVIFVSALASAGLASSATAREDCRKSNSPRSNSPKSGQLVLDALSASNKMDGDCPDFAESAEQNGTVPLSEAILLDALRRTSIPC